MKKQIEQNVIKQEQKMIKKKELMLKKKKGKLI